MPNKFYSTFLILTSCAAFGANQPITIINATVISPELAAELVGAWVRIDDGLISMIGTGPADTSGALVVDANGGYLTPGLIDSHVHLYHATGLKRRYTDNFDALYDAYIEQQPRSFLYFGFTTVIELNADTATNARFESAPVHPHLVHCGQGIVLSDGFMALELDADAIGDAYPGYVIDHYSNGLVPQGADAEEHRPASAVDFVLKHGGQCVKLYYEEALWWPGGAPSFRLPSVQIVQDIVSATHSHNIPVVLHATTPNGHQFAIDSGVDILAHGMWEWPGQALDTPNPLDEYEEIEENIANSGKWLQPTMTTIRNTASLFVPELLDDPEWLNVVPASYLDYLRTDAQRQKQEFLDKFASELDQGNTVDDIPALMAAFNSRYEKLIGRMQAGGARLIFGTDTAVGGYGWAAPPGLAAYWEMEAWVRAGIPLDALFYSLTFGNAQAFGLGEVIGTIEVGKRADLLILTANPLEDVSAYNAIDRVILDGKLISRSILSARQSDLTR
jgi:imidazolonepropionase-like amidohydrolase